MRGRELWRASLLLKPLLHVQPLMRAGDCVGGGEQATSREEYPKPLMMTP
jgi:hypothetical protein